MSSFSHSVVSPVEHRAPVFELGAVLWILRACVLGKRDVIPAVLAVPAPVMRDI